MVWCQRQPETELTHRGISWSAHDRLTGSLSPILGVVISRSTLPAEPVGKRGSYLLPAASGPRSNRLPEKDPFRPLKDARGEERSGPARGEASVLSGSAAARRARRSASSSSSSCATDRTHRAGQDRTG
eukprot:3941866-Rhodomonas_salina.3